MKNAEQDVSDLILAAATASNAAAQALVEADKAIMKADVDQHRRSLAEAVSQQHVLATGCGNYTRFTLKRPGQ